MDYELPDGTILALPDDATGADAAAAIGPGLARAALAVAIDGEVRDLARPLPPGGGRLAVITEKSGPEALALIRHDAAHVLASAVMELYPGVKISIGPPIEDGFYYDFEFPDGCSLSEADFERIEARMREHIAADEPFVRRDVSVVEGLERFLAEGQDYKVKLIEDLVADQHIDTVSLYTNGPFTDLCRGPHAPSTKRIKSFKLQSVAGAYWRGDARNPMLTRVYGTAFFSARDLEEYLERLERARANDHRRLGPQLGLFTFSEVAPGSAFWLPAGTRVYNELVKLSREMGEPRGYTEVKTPQLYDSALWKTSGHWDKYRENMFITESEGRSIAIKPMNCPGHCQLYSLTRHSYRDLPVRYSEPGLLHRHEPSGTLHGLLRVRHFAQDDGHIFCTEDQIQSEVASCLEFAFATYEIFGLDVRFELSTRPEQRIGSDELWDLTEAALASALESHGLAYDVAEGIAKITICRPETEDRRPHDRFARSFVAARNRPARLQHAQALRAGLHRRRQRRAHAGDDPSGPDGILRALHRDPARAPRGRAAGMARAGAGDRAADLRPPSRVRRRSPRAAARRRRAGRARRAR